MSIPDRFRVYIYRCTSCISNSFQNMFPFSVENGMFCTYISNYSNLTSDFGLILIFFIIAESKQSYKPQNWIWNSRGWPLSRLRMVLRSVIQDSYESKQCSIPWMNFALPLQTSQEFQYLTSMCLMMKPLIFFSTVKQILNNSQSLSFRN